MPFEHAATVILHRLVQRMRHRGHQAARSVTRQAGIGVQCNHVAHRGASAGVAGGEQKALARAAQPGIQVGDLATLALLADPGLLVDAPGTRPHQQHEWPCAVMVMPRIQCIDGGAGLREQGVVRRQGCARGIRQIEQQAKAQVRVAVAEVAHLEFCAQPFNRGSVARLRADSDDGLACIRNAGAEIHARHGGRQGAPAFHHAHQGQRQGARTGQRQQADQHQQPRAGIALARVDENGGCHQQHQDGGRANAGRNRRPACQGRQVVAHMARAHVQATFARRAVRAGQRQRVARNLDLVDLAGPGAAGNGMPVAVARGTVHGRVTAIRVGAQQRVDRAVRLGEGTPVDSAQQAQTGQRVAGRDGILGLFAVFALRVLRDAGAGIGQARVEPVQDLGHGAAAAMQAPRQFGDETVAGIDAAHHVGHQQDQVTGPRLGRVQQAHGPAGGLFMRRAGTRRARGKAPQVVDQGQAQERRQRVEFGDAQQRAFLVCTDEQRQFPGVDATIAMRDHVEHQAPGAHGAIRRQCRQHRSARLQASAHQAHLGVEQVVLVEQARPGRR